MVVRVASSVEDADGKSARRERLAEVRADEPAPTKYADDSSVSRRVVPCAFVEPLHSGYLLTRVDAPLARRDILLGGQPDGLPNRVCGTLHHAKVHARQVLAEDAKGEHLRA